MTMQKKAIMLYQIVAENMCPWDLFQANVKGSDGGDAEFRKKLGKYDTKEALENLVNEYI